jgi:predicted glycosyltransferase involved in capsule biosynthesis
VGGYDERFIGWGWEDLAFSCSLGALCGELTRTAGSLVHLYHEHPHEANFGQPNEPQNRALYERYYAAEHDYDELQRLIEEHACV